ncbi:MAG: hypothetical protein OXR66_08745 [Candidatus Woesearchaeota archaeon]|nr:hypothetical protein [Candidatus Woesearchaeota archaeon]
MGYATRFGICVGFLLSYGIFTTTLFIVTLLLGKSYTAQNVVLFTVGVMLLGWLLRRWLQ